MIRTCPLILLLSLLAMPAFVGAHPASERGRDSAQRGRTRRGGVRVSRASKDLDALIKRLRAEGVRVERGGKVSQPFFSAGGQVLSVEGEDVQVFRYATAAAAEREAGLVSPDGSSVGTNMMSWMSTPHFFRKDNLIVLYVGDNPAVLRALGAVLGTQFAGGGGGE
ncbi:MAG TPA: hypothetical protein VF521_06465 [Pyrinomonadaceae bacterium]|jgi:hypothetical protein